MTTRTYKGFTIKHLHGTMTFKVYLGEELFTCKSTLKEAKREIDRFLKANGI